MGDSRNRLKRGLVIFVVAAVSFTAGAIGVLKLVSMPSDRGWSGQRFFLSRMVGDSLIDAFHNLFYNRMPRMDPKLHPKWLGIPTLQYPNDLFVYQELINELKPDLILDIGTYQGGSAMYFASMLDLIHSASGRVISVDIQHPPTLPQHPRIQYLLGSSTSTAMVKQISDSIRPGDTVMVFLDSDHRMEHVLNELRTYAPLVTKGSYLVVEDSNINGHPVYPGFGPGPMEAIHAFLRENAEFESDRSREKFLITVAPEGFLLKK